MNMYTYFLGERLAELDIPEQLMCQDPHCTNTGHRQARDNFLLDVIISMIEVSHQTIPMGGGRRRKWDPDKNCCVEKSVPGWREDLEPLQQDSLFWHSLWHSCGRPTGGKLYEVMKYVRNKYHYAVRKCILA